MRHLNLILLLLLVGCGGSAGSLSNLESEPDSRRSRDHFKELFGSTPTPEYSGMRLYEHVGPMDQHYLFAFDFANQEHLIALLKQARFERQVPEPTRKTQIEKFVALHRSLDPANKRDTADDIAIKSTAFSLDEVGSKVQGIDLPDWWKAAGRIKDPVWFRKNDSAPRGYTYVWLNVQTKKGYAQTQ